MARAFESCFKYTDLGGEPFARTSTYAVESAGATKRVVLRPTDSCVSIVNALVHTLPNEVYLLIVLIASRRGRNSGRYQSPLMSLADAKDFLLEFGEFFDRDARSHLWIATPDGRSTIVWDNHQLVYAYGDVVRFEKMARGHGFLPGSVDLECPHRHNYHHLFDNNEEEVLDRFEWLCLPLQEGDN